MSLLAVGGLSACDKDDTADPCKPNRYGFVNVVDVDAAIACHFGETVHTV